MGTELLNIGQCLVMEPNRAVVVNKMAFSEPLYSPVCEKKEECLS